MNFFATIGTIALTVSIAPFTFLPANAAELSNKNLNAVTVYIVDGGYSPNKAYKASKVKDFTQDKGTLLDGKDCDRSWGAFHGNKVSSLVAKYSGSTSVNFVSLKALPCGDDYSNAFWYIYNALNYVADTHQKGSPAVVNLSMSTEKLSILLERPLARLEKLNIPVVAAAGNYGGDACDLYSAKSKRTITVGALNNNFNGIWSESNTGSCVNFYAGGSHVCVTEGDKVARCNSTSFATPVVSAIIANYLFLRPKSSVTEVKSMLTRMSKVKTFDHKGKALQVRYFANPLKIRF